MHSTSLKIQSVLRRTIDESAEVHCIDGEMPLSPFLSGSLSLYRATALGTSVLLAEDALNDDGASKRLKSVESLVKKPIAVFLPSAPAAQKRAMLAENQGFVTGQGDVYLPQLALALQTSWQTGAVSMRTFSPGQQQAFLYCLLEDAPLTQQGLRDKTGMSAAGASRALSSLSDAKLIDYMVGGKTGRKKEYFAPDKAELYFKGRKLFGNPIKSVEKRALSPAETYPLSGLSALASKSQLVGPSTQIVAIGPNVDIPEDETLIHSDDIYIVQRLAYDPLPFAQGGIVDPFTMLTTINETDERISMSLREALGGYLWYTD